MFPLPIPVTDFDNASEKASHDQMVSLVDQMLAFNQKLDRTRTAHEKELLERQIQTVDKRIDQLVYQLYDLTEDEISIVESRA